MSRYIDESILIEKLHVGEGLPTISRSVLVNCVLPTIPTADVVEVVRCKDCKHYNEYDNGEKIIGEEEVHDGWCMRWSGIENVNRHDYCSYGERAEE